MMVIIATCRVCGLEFEPDTASIRAGTWRDRCPHCQPPGAPKPSSEPRRFPGPRILSPRPPAALDGPEAS